MLKIVLFLSVINIGLGYGLAVYLMRGRRESGAAAGIGGSAADDEDARGEAKPALQTASRSDEPDDDATDSESEDLSALGDASEFGRTGADLPASDEDRSNDLQAESAAEGDVKTVEAVLEAESKKTHPADEDDATPESLEAASKALLALMKSGASPAGGSETIRAEWLEALRDNVKALGFLEAAQPALQLQVNAYRDQLLAMEERLLRRDGSLRSVQEICEKLGPLSQNWLEQQRAAARRLQQRHSGMVWYADASDRLERMLVEQSGKIGTIATSLRDLSAASDPPQAAESLLGEVQQLIGMCHKLRDRMEESLLVALADDDALQRIRPESLICPVTRAPNRFALHGVLSDAVHGRGPSVPPVSLAAYELEPLWQVNDAFGTRVGDRLLQATLHLTSETLRRQRGFDRTFRHSGSTFFTLLSEAAAKDGASAAERVRLTIEQAVFRHHGRHVPVTVCCGVVDVRAGEDPATIVNNALTVLLMAERAGGNRTCYQTSEGVATAEQLDFRPNPCECDLEHAALPVPVAAVAGS